MTLVTGGAGFIGSHLLDRLSALGTPARALVRRKIDLPPGIEAAPGDLASGDGLEAALRGVSTVIHLAGVTKALAARDYYIGNTSATEHLARAAAGRDLRFVHVSSLAAAGPSLDGVPVTEDTAPHPLTHYGKSKLEGEERAAAANAGSVIVRSGWIFGHDGTNFLSVMGKLLSEGKPVKAIRDSYGTPTYAADLAKRLRELAGMENHGIFHVTNSGEGTSYLGFAEEVCRVGGFDAGLLEAVSNADLKRPAPRPVSSKLGSVRGLGPLPNWEDGLKKHLDFGF